MSLKEFVDRNTCVFSVLACVFLTFSYVASLYVWRSTLHRYLLFYFCHFCSRTRPSELLLCRFTINICCRDHPSTIKRRFFSVSCMMLVAPFFTQYFFTEQTLAEGDVYQQLGLRWPGAIYASIAPFILTAILFLGPLTMQFFSGIWKLYAGNKRNIL